MTFHGVPVRVVRALSRSTGVPPVAGTPAPAPSPGTPGEGWGGGPPPCNLSRDALAWTLVHARHVRLLPTKLSLVSASPVGQTFLSVANWRVEGIPAPP